MSLDDNTPSTRPYMIRAMHEWCTDNGYTPYLAVAVDEWTQVPMEFVKDGQIVLNASYDATSQLVLGNERVEFRARFGGVARDISVPVDHVLAIYARENGQGMAFPAPATGSKPAGVDPTTKPEAGAGAAKSGESSPPTRPTLTRVK
jgi:stringent starvation protein B